MELPQELREKILSKPFHRQPSVQEFFGNASASSVEQGRAGIGQFAGLPYCRCGRNILYPSQGIIEFAESLPVFANTPKAAQKS